MEVTYKGARLIPDNDAVFMANLIAAVESADFNAIMSVSKQPEDYKFKISVSDPELVSNVMDSLITAGKFFGVFFNFSKSIKSSSTINFSIKNLVD